jgi:hypothetical protein
MSLTANKVVRILDARRICASSLNKRNEVSRTGDDEELNR